MNHSETIAVDFFTATISGNEHPELHFEGTSDRCKITCPWSFDNDFNKAAQWVFCLWTIFQRRGGFVHLKEKALIAVSSLSWDFDKIEQSGAEAYLNAVVVAEKSFAKQTTY